MPNITKQYRKLYQNKSRKHFHHKPSPKIPDNIKNPKNDTKISKTTQHKSTKKKKHY
jgi:hypothetical protein